MSTRRMGLRSMPGTIGRPKDRPTRGELVESWVKVYGHSPPKGLSTRLLHLACGYNRQVREQGGLKRAKLRELLKYAENPKENRPGRQTAPSTKPTVGTRLVREWRGQAHVVDVRGEDILYRGKPYRSLSQVARIITEARWSGPRFFGL